MIKKFKAKELNAMNIEQTKQSQWKSDLPFDTNDRASNLKHAGTGRTVEPDLKSKPMKVDGQQIPPHCHKSPHDTPINERNADIIKTLPILAQTSDFYEKLISHAQDFCQNIESKIADSEIQVTLDELMHHYEHERSHKPEMEWMLEGSDVNHLKESFKEVKGIGKFFESVMKKYDDNKLVTDYEQKIFRFLLTNLLNIDPNTDDSSLVYILKVLLKYFHPDKSGKHSDLYSIILSKGVRFAEMIKNNFGNESYDDPLIQSIVNLKKLDGLARIEASVKIQKEIMSLKASELKDNYKEKLLMSIIKSDDKFILDKMIYHLGINNLKVNNETPLIYAINNGCDYYLIKNLMENGDINALSLEGETPLQIAIDRLKNCNDKNPSRPSPKPYIEIIQCILNYHKLCVDAKDSAGHTALCRIASRQKLDYSSLQLIYGLINRGANIDQPIGTESGVTVRSVLKAKLDKKQFSVFERLADKDKLADIRIDPLPLIQSIADLNKIDRRITPVFRYQSIKEIEEKIATLKAGDLKDNDKETLLMTIIQSKIPDLLDLMIYRLGIDNIKVNNETPLIYAIQNNCNNIIYKLIEKEDVNTLGREGKTPLQIAISGLKEWKRVNPFSSLTSPYVGIIQDLLDCHKLCVDARDSVEGSTALCDLALQQKIDSTSLRLINQLINLGANIDQPTVSGITVRSMLKSKLNKDQFSEIERLAATRNPEIKLNSWEMKLTGV